MSMDYLTADEIADTIRAHTERTGRMSFDVQELARMLRDKLYPIAETGAAQKRERFGIRCRAQATDPQEAR